MFLIPKLSGSSTAPRSAAYIENQNSPEVQPQFSQLLLGLGEDQPILTGSSSLGLNRVWQLGIWRLAPSGQRDQHEF